MMNLINQILILDVLDRLGIKRKRVGSSISLIEDGKVTDGWKVYERENCVVDFSGKGRATGPPYPFLKAYLGMSAKQTFKWFQKNFGITSLYKKQKSKTKKKKRQVGAQYSSSRLRE